MLDEKPNFLENTLEIILPEFSPLENGLIAGADYLRPALPLELMHHRTCTMAERPTFLSPAETCSVRWRPLTLVSQR
jgi:hypothetical protein